MADKLLGTDYVPAFPQPLDASQPNYDDHGSPVPSGMSLRDYFAATALAAFSRDFQREQGHSDIGNTGIVAHKCYAMADAMLKERAKQGDV